MTLIEMMVVIFLIGIVSAVVGYNVKGSLEKGKRFKTEQGQRQIREILLWEYAHNPKLKLEDLKDYQKILKKSSLVKSAKDLELDGWGDKYLVVVDEDNDDITVSSSHLAPKLVKKNPAEPVPQER